ncbi:MAG: cytochrome c oxidase subunit II, partial [Actinomycetota bacterium]|nr:cytochrome c oxidase subunit II [Actinomycetota bacterium]
PTRGERRVSAETTGYGGDDDTGKGRMPGGLEPHGPASQEIADLWWLMFWLGLLVFFVFAGVLGSAMFRRSRRGHAADPLDQPDPGTSAGYVRRWIVGLGVVMTTVVLVVVLAFTIGSIRAIPTAAARDALRLELVAHQWHWEVQYPDDGIETKDTVRIPVDTAVELRLSSADVIHSFWVPALAGKMDAIPGKVNTIVVEADEPGTYRGQCAEFCGLNHATMRVTVIAMERAAFERWLEEAR